MERLCLFNQTRTARLGHTAKKSFLASRFTSRLCDPLNMFLPFSSIYLDIYLCQPVGRDINTDKYAFFL